MIVNITMMGDGYVITFDNETQEVFHKNDFVKMQQRLGEMLMCPFDCDIDIVQIEMTIKTEEFTDKNATPVAPRPFEV